MVTHIRIMNSAAQSRGPSGFFQNLARYGIIAASAIAGLFVLLLTASAAIVVVLTLLLIGALAFGFFWIRAKVFGKPIGGQAFADMRAAAAAAQQNGHGAESLFTRAPGFDGGFDGEYDDDGDVIDARKTPDGWSVES